MNAVIGHSAPVFDIFFFQAEDGIRDLTVTGVQTCALPIAYQNKGTKAMRAFQGDATFLDTFGDSIYSAHLRVDMALAPGQTRREPARIVRFNPFRVAHQRLRDTPLEKMKLVWETTDVVFADGTRLSLSADRTEP